MAIIVLMERMHTILYAIQDVWTVREISHRLYTHQKNISLQSRWDIRGISESIRIVLKDLLAWFDWIFSDVQVLQLIVSIEVQLKIKNLVILEILIARNSLQNGSDFSIQFNEFYRYTEAHGKIVGLLSLSLETSCRMRESVPLGEFSLWTGYVSKLRDKSRTGTLKATVQNVYDRTFKSRCPVTRELYV